MDLQLPSNDQVMDAGQATLCDTFQRDFLCCRRIGSLPWKELDQELTLEPPLALCILKKTINHPVCRKYPPSLQYRRLFLSELIKKHERTGAEPLDDLYSALAEVLNSEDPAVCYKSYCLPTGDLVTLSENVAIVSEGTTGLVTWEAALFLAEWAIEHNDIFNNRMILELGSGIGLTGLVICKSCFPKKYTFTDCHQKVLQQLKDNIRLNGFMLEEEHSVTSENPTTLLSVTELDWESVTEQQLLNLDADLVIAADVVYDPEIVTTFTKLLKQLFHYTKAGKKMEILVASTIRSPETYRLFQRTLDDTGLRWQVLPDHKRNIFAYDRNCTVQILKVTLQV
ncbi:protein-lysine N-methyltransferase EEF2KMT [Hyla sarda]|uniref:protein-lysine N-methyltransferase EEF2KMT n=1 Tax=Hyla sarda TaxID=327740 RepID=UPI0024C2C674|nr:protein-lysine N-methyltransferase EEF2KMT [Hyla sarda]XP_056393038.1 protein-lysine N-methyltransferase EEF2KMT [Hyla sarda]XP_056393039.1 protein-lysine N-methyltransferase EEF2KMT [Hyla sarda]